MIIIAAEAVTVPSGTSGMTWSMRVHSLVTWFDVTVSP